MQAKQSNLHYPSSDHAQELKLSPTETSTNKHLDTHTHTIFFGRVSWTSSRWSRQVPRRRGSVAPVRASTGERTAVRG